MASEPIIQAFDNACVRIRAEGLHSIKELAERVKHNGLESEPRVQRGWRRVQNALRETTERQALLQEVQMIFAPSTPQSGVNSSTAPINITAPADSNSTTSRRKRSAMELPNAPLSKRTIKHRNGKNDLLSRLDRIASTAETSSDEAKKSLEQDLRRGQKLKDRMNVVHRKRRAKWIKIKEVECKTFQAAVDKGWIKGFIPGEDVRKLSKTPKESHPLFRIEPGDPRSQGLPLPSEILAHGKYFIKKKIAKTPTELEDMTADALLRRVLQDATVEVPVEALGDAQASRLRDDLMRELNKERTRVQKAKDRKSSNPELKKRKRSE